MTRHTLHVALGVLLALGAFLGLLTLGEQILCAAHDQSLRYCEETP